MNLLWLQSGGCGGCTMSLLCHDAGDVTGTLRARSRSATASAG